MNWTAIEALAPAIAAILAYVAWRTGQRTLRISYRPASEGQIAAAIRASKHCAYAGKSVTH